MTTATAVGYVEMRIAKVVGLSAADDELFQYVVLEDVSGDRHLAIEGVRDARCVRTLTGTRP